MKLGKLIIILSVFFLVYCENSLFYSTPKGTLIGYANLMYQSNDEGVKVSFNNVDRHVFSDSTGKWTIYNLPQSTYTITFSKEGYGTYKYFGYGFIGGDDEYFSFDGNIDYVNLYKIPDYSIAYIDVEIDTFEYYNNQYYINISGALSEHADSDNKVFAFVGVSDNVSSEPDNYVYSQSTNINQMDSLYSLIIFVNSSLYELGLKSDSNIFIRLYVGCYGGYFDPEVGCWINTGLNPNSSDVVEIVLP